MDEWKLENWWRGMANSRRYLLAADSWIALAGGPKHVRDLAVGDELRVVRRDGTIGTSPVVAAHLLGERVECSSLLTGAGELVLPPGSRVVTRQGVERTEDLALMSRTGQAVRIEVVRPGDVFEPRPTQGSAKDAYRASLRTLNRSQIVVPAWLSEDRGVGGRIEEVLSIAGVEYRAETVDYWRVYHVASATHAGSEPAAWGNPRDQAEALLLFTAWSLDGEDVVSRVIVGDVVYMQRLTGSLAGSGQGYDVKWIPGYRPVEAHISRSGQDRSHVAVDRAAVRRSDIFAVYLEANVSIIAGLALVS